MVVLKLTLRHALKLNVNILSCYDLTLLFIMHEDVRSVAPDVAVTIPILLRGYGHSNSKSHFFSQNVFVP